MLDGQFLVHDGLCASATLWVGIIELYHYDRIAYDFRIVVIAFMGLEWFCCDVYTFAFHDFLE